MKTRITNILSKIVEIPFLNIIVFMPLSVVFLIYSIFKTYFSIFAEILSQPTDTNKGDTH